jgi:hypothetical protein
MTMLYRGNDVQSMMPLRSDAKALLFEMGVKSERVPDSQSSHDFKADTINEAETSP